MIEHDTGFAALVELNGYVLGVDLVVVPRTQQNQIVQTSWSTLAPVLNVVALGVARVMRTVVG